MILEGVGALVDVFGLVLAFLKLGLGLGLVAPGRSQAEQAEGVAAEEVSLSQETLRGFPEPEMSQREPDEDSQML